MEEEKKDPASSEKPPAATDSTPKRFSSETLFTFALPEAVSDAMDPKTKQMVEALISKSKEGTEKKEPWEKKTTPASTTPSKAKAAEHSPFAEQYKKSGSRSRVAPIVGTAIIVGVAVGGFASYWFAQDRSRPATTNTKVATDNTLPTKNMPEATPAVSETPPVVKLEATSPKVEPSPLIKEEPGQTPPPFAEKTSLDSQLSPSSDTMVANVAALEKLTKEMAATVSDPILLRYLVGPDLDSLPIAIREASKRQNTELHKQVVLLSDHPSYMVRITVVKEVTTSGQYSQDEQMQVLLKRINDDEYLVRGFAAKALAALNTEPAIRALNERLLIEENESIKQILEKVTQ